MLADISLQLHIFSKFLHALSFRVLRSGSGCSRSLFDIDPFSKKCILFAGRMWKTNDVEFCIFFDFVPFVVGSAGESCAGGEWPYFGGWPVLVCTVGRGSVDRGW